MTLNIEDNDFVIFQRIFPNNDYLQWRDHWMQAVYYPMNELEVQKG